MACVVDMKMESLRVIHLYIPCDKRHKQPRTCLLQYDGDRFIFCLGWVQVGD